MMQIAKHFSTPAFFWEIPMTILRTLVFLPLNNISDAAPNLASPTRNLTTAPNLSVPRLPGFKVDTRYQPRRSINEFELYTLIIEGMASVGPSPWEGIINLAIGWTPPELHCDIFAMPLPPAGPSTFRIKHFILGMYELGCRMLGQHFYATYALLSVQGTFIASISLQPVVTPSPWKHDLASISLQPTSLSATELGAMRPALQGESFEVQDPGYASLKLVGVFNGETIAFADIFTTFLDALAEAAVPAVDETGAYVNAVSAGDPRAIMNVHDVGSPRSLTYNLIFYALLDLWKMFFVEKKYGGLEFSIFLDEREIGRGSIDEWSFGRGEVV